MVRNWRGGWRGLAMLCLGCLGGGLLTGMVACRVSRKNEVSRQLLRPVALTITGRLVDGSTGLTVPGLLVDLARTPLGTETRETVAESHLSADAEGMFKLAALLYLEAYQYRLVISDPEGVWVTHDATTLFATRDGGTDLGELKLQRAQVEQVATVSGTVRAALGGDLGSHALAAAKVKLIDTTGRVLSEATTDASGRDSLGSTPLRDADLTVACVGGGGPATSCSPSTQVERDCLARYRT